jgi:hypothetical protein
MKESNEILCYICGRIALARREPQYEGFKKTGEIIICTACGHRYTPEEPVQFQKISKRPKIFTEDDKPDAINIFSEDERGRCCRHCKHFVINPFTQWCGLHKKNVQATDLCFDFCPPDDDSQRDHGEDTADG